MQSVSQDFLDALTGSPTLTVQVDVWRDGQLQAEALPVTGGQVQITGGQAIRSDVSLLVADEDGALVPTGPDDPLSIYGNELHIRAGVQFPGGPELVSLGRFPITRARGRRQTARYSRSDKDVYVSRSGTVDVQAKDRAQLIAENRFITRTQPSKPTILAEIATLLQGTVPWAGSSVSDRSVPSSITYEDDRLAAAGDLADALGCDLIMDPDGVAVLQPRTMGAPVWAVTAGAAGMIIDSQSEQSRDGVYNAAVVWGQSDDTRTLRGFASVADGPMRWDGPMGRIPYFQSSPLMITQAQVDAAARTTLARITSRRTQDVQITCVSNPALQVGDAVQIPGDSGALVTGQVMSITWPVVGGSMALTVAVDPIEWLAAS